MNLVDKDKPLWRFNGSTGEGNEGDTDMRGPWTTSHGLHLVLISKNNTY